MRGRRRATAPAALLLVVGLAACTPALPESVVPGTKVTAAWTGEYTSANAAASPTPGNIDIAATTRGTFGDIVDGEFLPDESFGTVSIVGDDPFTVQYDLAEPAWSDGIPLDAADLLLGWAGEAGWFAVTDAETDAAEDPDAADPDAAEQPIPRIDEFARSIEVAFPQPDSQWQQAVTVPVPAHVVGRRAFGTDDAMEAKQAVIRAIEDEDADALAAIAEVWNEGFEISDSDDIPADLLLSSGPFRVDEVAADADGQTVRLVPNPAYRGVAMPKVARIDLVPPGESPLTALGDRLDVVPVTPITAAREPVRELERKDFTVETTHDGTVWAVLLKQSGVFSSQRARTAFIHAVPASSLRERGGGLWASAYTASTSMLSAPGSRPYDIVNEDSGFAAVLGDPGDDPALERQSAGIGTGARVCVLYDRDSEFAVGAFSAARVAAAESGWDLVDCGASDLAAAREQGGWDAVITRVAVPQSPAEIAAQWGSGGSASVIGSVDADRDALIAQLAQATDVYEAREIRAQIEATIVRASVALPIAVNPRVTVIDKDVTGVALQNGSTAPLTRGVVQWEATP